MQKSESQNEPSKAKKKYLKNFKSTIDNLFLTNGPRTSCDKDIKVIYAILKTLDRFLGPQE